MLPDETARLRHICYVLVSWRHWDLLVLVLIVVNAVTLAIAYHGMSDAYSDSLAIVNNVLAFLFVMELLVRIAAFSPQQFFQSAWDRFDAALVISVGTVSCLSIAFDFWQLSFRFD